jgi:hypothetical protein
MDEKYCPLVLAFLAAFALRLYPTILSGLPFSTDAWSPIRNTELLLERTPISLNSAVMDITVTGLQTAFSAQFSLRPLGLSLWRP